MSEQPSEEIRALKARLAAVEGQLAAVEARNSQLLREKHDMAVRLAKGKELMSALVATVPELAFLSDAGQSAADGDAGAPSGAPQQKPAGNPLQRHEPATVTAAIPAAAPRAQELAAEAVGRCSVSAAIPAAPAQETLPIGLLFPGGERQYVGIMSSVKDIPAVQDMFERAKTVLRFDLLKLCLEGPAEELAKVCEPVMYIAGLAGVEKLRREREEAVRLARGMAGAGLGECVALVAAGVLSFEDGLALVRARSDSICGAARVRKQATAVIAGLDKPKLTELCAAAAKMGGSGAVCQISGELFTLGFTVGGTEKSVRVLKDLAEKAGAIRVHMELANAHNTPLLEPAKEMLSAFLDELLPKMSPPRVSVYMTATATPVRPGTPPKDVAAVLKEEMTSMMLWAPSIRAMIKEGVSQFYEVGPGETLKGHMRHIDAKLWRSMTNMLV